MIREEDAGGRGVGDTGARGTMIVIDPISCMRTLGLGSLRKLYEVTRLKGGIGTLRNKPA